MDGKMVILIQDSVEILQRPAKHKLYFFLNSNEAGINVIIIILIKVMF